MGSVIMMVATTVGGTESGIVSMDIPKNGFIVGVEWAATLAYDTTSDSIVYQLSFGSVVTVANDSRQVISCASGGQNTLATAVRSQMGVIDRYVALPDIPVSMGERLFIHAVSSATTVGRAFCSIHFNFDLDQPMARRR